MESDIKSEAVPSQSDHDRTYDPSLFYQHRLSLPFPLRLPLGGLAAFLGGASLGVAHGGKMAGMRFRAEHAHVFPTTTTGWYFYHKSKNYNVMLGAIKEGLKMGLKISFWAGSFLVVEEAVDRLRGSADFGSTVLAGVSVAGGFSAWNRLPFSTAARTTKTGLIGGVVFGLAEDAVGFARGRQIRYIDYLLSRKSE